MVLAFMHIHLFEFFGRGNVHGLPGIECFPGFHVHDQVSRMIFANTNRHTYAGHIHFHLLSRVIHCTVALGTNLDLLA